MLVVPIVFFSLLTGVANLKNINSRYNASYTLTRSSFGTSTGKYMRMTRSSGQAPGNLVFLIKFLDEISIETFEIAIYIRRPFQGLRRF